VVTRQSQLHHDRMVKAIADFLVERDFADVRADIAGFAKPLEITTDKDGSARIPDVTGRGQFFVVFEVETSDSIDDAHTQEQWGSFAAWAKRNGAAFYIAVPEASKQRATERAAQLGVEAKIVEV